jgi:glycosyltransferase involved in cell wall biosynthesis
MLHVHSGLVELWLSDRPHKLFAHAFLWPANMLLAASEGSRDALASALRGKRIVLVDNGIDTSIFRPGAGGRERPVVASAGFLTPRKGTGDLLEASRLLHQRGVDHELVLAGDPIPEAGGLQLEALRAGAGAQVGFLGYVAPDAMPDFYATSDVFCLASWWEAMPISVLEAMASGLPVVATKVGDIPRAVEDGVTGLLVPARSTELLTDALEKVLGDVDLRLAMGRAGRRRVQARFSLQTTTDALERLYREALG